MKMENWGFKILKLRLERGWTQEDLGRKSGIKRGTISPIELGHIQTPSPENIASFAKAFKMSESQLQLYFITGNRPADKISTEELLNELKERVSDVTKLPEMLVLRTRGYINAGVLTPAEQQDMDDTYVKKSDVAGAMPLNELYALIVSGESLIGDGISNEDAVVIEPNPEILEGKIYVFKIDNQFVARHLHLDDGFAILTSSNGKYTKIKADELEIVGRIIFSQPPGRKH